MPRIETLAEATKDSTGSENSLYLYAFVEGERGLESLSPEANAIESAALRLFRAGRVAALAASTPTADFIGVAGERNLGDPAWLAARCRRHESVIELAMQDGAVFPAGFGTLFSSAEALVDFVRRHERSIAEFLRETSGHEEWEVSAFAALDAHDLLERTAASEWPDFLALSPGARYLRLCRERPTLIASAGRHVQQAAIALLTELRDGLQPSNALLRPARPRLRIAETEKSGECVGSLVLLLRSEQRANLHAELASLERSTIEGSETGLSLRLAVSGPWPPYSFRPALDRDD